MREIDKIRQDENIREISKLCIDCPKLNMNEIAYCLGLSVEEVYRFIKEYNLPYYWKFKAKLDLTKEDYS